jgi:uncharacterized protein (TIGR04255 family)
MGVKLKNAPVYFTILQIRHNTVTRLSAYADVIQDEMRKAGYPDFKKTVAVAISFTAITEGEQQNIGSQQPIERLMFFNTNNTQGFVVEPSAITFHTTDYDTFETFSAEFLKGVSIINKSIQLSYIDRIGMRFLDAVVPPDGLIGMNQFLDSSVIGLINKIGDKGKASHSLSETLFNLDNCAVVARTIIIPDGTLGFPMDIQPFNVNLADKFLAINGPHAIVDTDASINHRLEFDESVLPEHLKKLRTCIGVAFESLVTKEAINYWNT